MSKQHWVFWRFSVLAIGAALFVPAIQAQLGSAYMADGDAGRPPQAPLITFLGIVNPGKLATDPSLPLKGPVAEVLYEELRGQRTPAGPAGEVVRSIRTTYDTDGHAVKEVSAAASVESITISRYERNRLVSQETTLPTTKTPLLKFWNYWTYDADGKLTEFRRGKGDELQNHELNFKRDSEGRLTSFEYRQGAKDEPFSRTEVRYSNQGKTAENIYYDAKTGEEIRSMTQTVDDRGHVIQVEIRERDWKTKQPKPPLRVTFRYDAKGRMVEQNTGDHEFDAAGSEEELPPGRISIEYDDVKQTKTTSYSGPDGGLAMKLTFDANGATIGLSGGSGTETMDARLDCKYDTYGNWTAYQEVARGAGGGSVAKVWRRTITYR